MEIERPPPCVALVSTRKPATVFRFSRRIPHVRPEVSIVIKQPNALGKHVTNPTGKMRRPTLQLLLLATCSAFSPPTTFASFGALALATTNPKPATSDSCAFVCFAARQRGGKAADPFVGAADHRDSHGRCANQ